MHTVVQLGCPIASVFQRNNLIWGFDRCWIYDYNPAPFRGRPCRVQGSTGANKTKRLDWPRVSPQPTVSVPRKPWLFRNHVKPPLDEVCDGPTTVCRKRRCLLMRLQVSCIAGITLRLTAIIVARRSSSRGQKTDFRVEPA